MCLESLEQIRCFIRIVKFLTNFFGLSDFDLNCESLKKGLIYFQISFQTKQKFSDPNRIEWIVKTDDDISVDWSTFSERLSTYKGVEENLFCHVVLKNRLPMRKTEYKL
jgi:hypothetical protein